MLKRFRFIQNVCVMYYRVLKPLFVFLPCFLESWHVTKGQARAEMPPPLLSYYVNSVRAIAHNVRNTMQPGYTQRAHERADGHFLLATII